jgi:UDP-3-O-[3-hydroxymyristoyl] glucosamine N-acyltransferase
MVDPRFFELVGPFSLGQLAQIAGAELSDGADPKAVIRNVAPIDVAGPSDVSFLDNKRYLDALADSNAGACIIDPHYADRAGKGMALLLTKQPYSAYAKVAWAFYPRGASLDGVHQTAIVDPSAKLGDKVSLGPYVVVGPGAEIGIGCHISAQAVIGPGVVIGDDTRVGPGSSLSHCLIGRRCQLHDGVRIGTRGFGFAMDPEGYVDVPQLGRVIIEDDVEVGANVTIDRGAGPDTVVGAGAKIDNLVQIGHNVQIGRGCILVAQSGIAGSTKLEDQVVLAAQAGVAGHLRIGKGAQIAAKCGVMRDVAPGQIMCGYPAMPIKEFFRPVALWQRQLKVQVKKYE